MLRIVIRTYGSHLPCWLSNALLCVSLAFGSRPFDDWRHCMAQGRNYAKIIDLYNFFIIKKHTSFWALKQLKYYLTRFKGIWEKYTTTWLFKFPGVITDWGCYRLSKIGANIWMTIEWNYWRIRLITILIYVHKTQVWIDWKQKKKKIIIVNLITWTMYGEMNFEISKSWGNNSFIYL